MDESDYKTIEDELQICNFKDEYQKAFLNLLFTANVFVNPIIKELRECGLTHAQFNVLRILSRQKNNEPLSAADIQCRMLHPTSNVTRILDKLSEKELILCHTCSQNRRKNDVSLTEKGLRFVKQTNYIAEAASTRVKKNIGKKDAEKLNEILDRLRNHQ